MLDIARTAALKVIASWQLHLVKERVGRKSFLHFLLGWEFNIDSVIRVHMPEVKLSFHNPSTITAQNHSTQCFLLMALQIIPVILLHQESQEEMEKKCLATFLIFNDS